MKVHIEQGTPDKASHIASLIMEAMNTDCCQNFAGPHHTLVDFHQMMERLVKMEDSQYSYLNTLVASNSEGIIAKQLLAAAIEKARELGIPKVGLLVDKGNPRAEKLYTKVGFEYVNDTVWGGHGMRHLQYTI